MESKQINELCPICLENDEISELYIEDALMESHNPSIKSGRSEHNRLVRVCSSCDYFEDIIDI